MQILGKFEKKLSYLHTGNYFSRSLIIQENKDLFPLLVVESEQSATIYKKIFEALEVPVYALETEDDYIDCFLNQKTSYIISLHTFKNFRLYVLEKKISLCFQKWVSLDIQKAIEILTTYGYNYSEFGTKWSYKKQGDILYIRSFSGTREYSISFWWDTIESIEEKVVRNSLISKTFQREKIFVGSNKLLIPEGDDFFENVKQTNRFTILDNIELFERYETVIETLENFVCFELLPNRILDKVDLKIESISCESIEDFKNLLSKKKTTIVYTKNKKLIDNFTEYNDLQNIQVHESKSGVFKSFSSPKLTVICDDVIQKVFVKKRVQRSFGHDMDLLLKIKTGDYVVHIDHGIGLYQWIIEKTLWNTTKEYLEIVYKDQDKLFVPITEVERVSKYVWLENPELTNLNGKEWTRSLEKVDKEVSRIAEELIDIYAKRQIETGHSFIRYDKELQNFQDAFPYTYTTSQTQSIEEILTDMSKEKSMDRILIGDVWFWKTEIAFNAIYNCILNKKQALFLSPLVVLAYEHFEKARDRFSQFWVKFDVLTRLESQKHTSAVMKKLASWELDFVIGTHKVLSEKMQYKNLGLIVIDEEHKFWVEDKEKIKQIKTNIDCLSMSATPIPRSLNLALSGIRDISLLKEPPQWRKDIVTTVAKFDEHIILEAGKREFERGGQIFFIHNRVENIHTIEQKLQGIFPDKKIVITHGRLPGDELEDRIIDFKEKKYDILISTTVIENGIDFSNVNTIFINECQSFGLSQIHQLRGRVGRSDKEGYCYLLYRKEIMTDETVQRLKTIVKYSYLGAGFEIAIKDLEIRWWGDILWIRQSGQATEVGINLYIELLEKKVEELKQSEDYVKKKYESVRIDLDISAFIPDEYFNTESDKLNFYKELEFIKEKDDLKSIIDNFQEINPEFPIETKSLFDILELKIEASAFGVTHIKRVWINYQLEFRSNITVPELKNFLELDKEVLFHIVSLDKIRTSKSHFRDDRAFLDYLLQLFSGFNSTKKSKIRLVSKS
jgi:transcription-repair coupling factor